MTPDAFRLIALSLAETRQANDLGVQGFKTNDRLFATLGSPNAAWAMLKLSPEEQAAAITAAPQIFTPEAGGAGHRGATRVRLAAAEPGPVRRALMAAHRRARQKSTTASKAR